MCHGASHAHVRQHAADCLVVLLALQALARDLDVLRAAGDLAAGVMLELMGTEAGSMGLFPILLDAPEPPEPGSAPDAAAESAAAAAVSGGEGATGAAALAPVLSPGAVYAALGLGADVRKLVSRNAAPAPLSSALSTQGAAVDVAARTQSHAGVAGGRGGGSMCAPRPTGASRVL